MVRGGSYVSVVQEYFVYRQRERPLPMDAVLQIWKPEFAEWGTGMVIPAMSSSKAHPACPSLRTRNS